MNRIKSSLIRRRIITTYIIIIIITTLFVSTAYAHKPTLSSIGETSVSSDTYGKSNYFFSKPSDSIKKIAARPTDLDHSAVSASGLFRVHYDIGGDDAVPLTDTAPDNNIPDFVDSCLIYLDYAHDHIVNTLGFPSPNPDNGEDGGTEIDVYLQEYGSRGIYGEHYSVSTPDGLSGYILMDNNFEESMYASKDYDGLKVTTAHELFHTVQLAYFYRFDLVWWMEQTAVWMETQVWPDVKDYLAYLYLYFDSPNKSLDDQSYYMYGAAIWPMFLEKEYGTGMVRTIWDTLATANSSDIAVFDRAIKAYTDNSADLIDAFGSFATWNYFTSDRGNTDYFTDSPIFSKKVSITESLSFSPAVTSYEMSRLTNKFIEVLFTGDFDANDFLRVNITNENGVNGHSVIFYNSPSDHSIYRIPPSGTDIRLEKKWDKAVIVVSNGSTGTVNATYDIYVEGLYKTSAVDGSGPSQFLFHGASPNPFNPTTTLSFQMPESGEVTAEVYNASGQLVEILYNGYMQAGEKRIVWNTSNNADAMAAGLYFVRIVTPYGMKTTKLLLVK